nr:MAG TPA: hypothetical protein [Caudoviricetes sp.]
MMFLHILSDTSNHRTEYRSHVPGSHGRRNRLFYGRSQKMRLQPCNL